VAVSRGKISKFLRIIIASPLFELYAPDFPAKAAQMPKIITSKLN